MKVQTRNKYLKLEHHRKMSESRLVVDKACVILEDYFVKRVTTNSPWITFPPEIAVTTLSPDLVPWSTSLQEVYLIELTIPQEDSVDECQKQGWLLKQNFAVGAQKVHLLEVGWRGFVTTSTTKLLKGQNLRQFMKAASEATAMSSGWRPLLGTEDAGGGSGLFDARICCWTLERHCELINETSRSVPTLSCVIHLPTLFTARYSVIAGTMDNKIAV